jgi:copper oxidase (laccase) domain-containing protein
LVWEVGGGKGRADMKACLARQLAGVGVERVEVVAGCTVRDAELFYSHRRERGVTGRMVGVIGARG